MLQARKDMKVAVLGASGGIGQPLSLLLKLMPTITHLNLYDIAHTPGVAADLSHIETRAKVCGFLGQKELHDCLQGADIVLIPAGVPRKPGLKQYFFCYNYVEPIYYSGINALSQSQYRTH